MYLVVLTIVISWTLDGFDYHDISDYMQVAISTERVQLIGEKL